MKKMFLLLATMLLGTTLSGQDSSDKLYLIFELMHVDNEQEAAYAETENFWEKIHEQRVQRGDIVGWDLWSLLPGGKIRITSTLR